MDLANQLLGKLKNNLPTAEPVVRHGEIPTFSQVSTKQEMIVKLVRFVGQLKKQDYTSVAVIGKTEKECHWIHKELRTHIDVQLLQESDDMESEVIIVPSYLAKGLEFDAVLIVSFDEMFEQTEIDLKLLYVAMTRGMHNLNLLGKHPIHFQLSDKESKLWIGSSSS